MPRLDPDEHVDRRIGERIRRRRVELGLTQEQLGRRVTLSYQQIQKYERGANRIMASKLVAIAVALEVAPAYFFEDLNAPDAAPAHGGTLRPEIELARSFARIADPEVRSSLAGLVRSLAGPFPCDEK